MTTTSSPLDPQDVAAHLDALRALARRLVRDGGVAEDVAQDAWLAAVGRGRRGDVPLKWWLAGVVKNVARHVRRDEATRRRHELATPPRGDAESPDALVERTELHHRLVGAVLALDEPYRATVLMRYFEDLSAAEIARRAGVPAATVRSRLKRGLDMLRARLDGEHGGRRAWALAFAPFAWTDRAGRGTSWLPAAACALLVLGALLLWKPWDGADYADAAETAVAAAPADKPAPAAPRGGANRPRRARGDVAAAEAADETPAAPQPPAPAETQADGGKTGLSIEVVDEDGRRVEGGEVKLELANILQLSDFGVDLLEKFFEHLPAKPLGGANPIVVENLVPEMEGLELEAFARVPGLPPTAAAKVKVRAGRIEPVRLVAAKPRSVAVMVVDRATEAPVANASIVSTTELSRRDVEPATVRGTTAPGAAVTDPAGRCVLSDLGGGEHAVEIDAKGYRRSKTKWSEGELRVALTPQRGGGTVSVLVLGPDGAPLADMGVKLWDTDRVARTGADGRVAFADVPAGRPMVSLDVAEWGRRRMAQRWTAYGEVPCAYGDLVEGAALELSLGFVRASASFTARFADETGAPMAGVEFGLEWGDRGTASDETGVVRLASVKPGSYPPRVVQGPHETWFLDEDGMTVVADGARLSGAWTLGSATVRGRLVDVDGRGVAGVDVHVAGPLRGLTRTDADGRFSIRRARAGGYRLSASSEDRQARLLAAPVPSDEELVLTMVPCGRVAVRYASADRAQLREAEFDLLDADGESAGNLEPAQGEDDLRSTHFLFPARYEVKVTADGRSRTFPVEVKSGATAVVEVSVP